MGFKIWAPDLCTRVPPPWPWRPLGECGNLPLEVDREGVRPPSSDDLDGAVGDMGLVEGHGAARAQGVGADLMGV